jgi:TatD DNase family protein
MYRLVDVHAHLEDVKDLEVTLERAKKVGVCAVVTAGSDYYSSRWALQLSERRSNAGPRVYAVIGVHPWNLRNMESSKIDSTLEFIQANVDKAVGVGEIGLDYWLKEARKDESKRELQKKTFKSLLEIAKDCEKPVVVHSRGAWKDCFDLVKDAGVKEAVFHWFTGPLDVLESLLEEGYKVSATPAVAYSKELRRTIQNTPIEKILLETDSPVNYRGKTAEPGDVVITLNEVAALKGIEKEDVADKTTRNAVNFFNVPDF